MTVHVEAMRPEDWDAVRSIFVEGIETGIATLETEPPSRKSWDGSHLPQARLVARSDGSVVGWAALSPINTRCVYGGVAEVSVYVAADLRGRGVGRALLESLVRESEEHGIWTLEAGIFPENEASVAIHERCGFRIVGTRKRIGQLRGVWRDVLLLERRSDRIGAD